MYAEITKVKKLTIAQYNNNVQLYFDAVQFLKLQIDQKDPNAYTEDAYICDIFLQLKHDSLPAEFRLEFAHQETHWMMNKSNISSQGLIDDASTYYVNLKNLGAWKVNLSKNLQLIALTTQISELENKVSKLSTDSGYSKQNEEAPVCGNNKYISKLWRLNKVDNKAEHSMIECNGKTWYCCNNHRYNNKGVTTNGMYMTHKPKIMNSGISTRRKVQLVGEGRTPLLILHPLPTRNLSQHLPSTILLHPNSQFLNHFRLRLL